MLIAIDNQNQAGLMLTTLFVLAERLAFLRITSENSSKKDFFFKKKKSCVVKSLSRDFTNFQYVIISPKKKKKEKRQEKRKPQVVHRTDRLPEKSVLDENRNL